MMTLSYIVSQKQIKRKSEKKWYVSPGNDFLVTSSERPIFSLRLYLLTRTILVQVGENRGRPLACATRVTSLPAPEVAILLLPTL